MNLAMKMKQIVFALAIASALAGESAPLVKSGEKIAFLGDSITQFGDYATGYINLVMSGLEIGGVTGCVKVAAGVSGNKSPQMLARLQKDVLSKKPDWMTFSCGVNDVWHGARGVALPDYEKNVKAIFDACDAAKVKVIVMTATLIGEDVANSNNCKAVAYNDFLRAEAKARGYVLADENAAMRAELRKFPATDTRKNKLTKDGVHMDFPGNRMMAYCILDAMGIDPALHAKMDEKWRKIPWAYSAGVGLSYDQYKEVQRLMKAEGYGSMTDYMYDKLLEKKRR